LCAVRARIGSITVLLALCLVGATAPRPRVVHERTEPSPISSQVELAKAPTDVVLAPRRNTPAAPDLRLAWFTLPAAPAITNPPRASFVTTVAVATDHHLARTLPRTSRGPPAG
jgi:hypothetical protein